MYCLRCAYKLEGLEEHRCPECGLVFDPDDAQTFDAVLGHRSRDHLAKWFEWTMIATAAMPVIANIFAYVKLFGARIWLGYWPHRTGVDDPSSIQGIRLLSTCSQYLVLLSLPATVCAVMCGVALLACRAWKRAARGWLIALVLWTSGSAMFHYDPHWVWSWIFD